MKSKKVLLCLTTFSLLCSGLASCDQPSNSDSSLSHETLSSSNSSEEIEAVAHNVNLEVGDGAYAFVDKPSAVVGEPISVTVVMTDPAYVLKGVKLGDQSLNSQVNPDNDKVTVHGFLMPNEDAEIVVETVLPVKDHLLTFEGADLVDVIGLDSSANEGDTVNFKLRLLSGYALDSVRAFKVVDSDASTTDGSVNNPDSLVEINVYDEGNGEYSLEMPDGDVKIVANASGAYFKVAASTSQVVCTTSHGNEWKATDFVDAFLDDENNFEFGKSGIFQAGKKAVFRAKRPGENSSSGDDPADYPDCYATNYYVDGIEVYQAHGYEDSYHSEYYAYEFTMPNKNVEITVKAVERKISVKMDLPEQVEGYAYTLDEEGKEVKVTDDAKFTFGDKIYFKANQKADVSVDDYQLVSTYASIPVYAGDNLAVEREDTFWNGRVNWTSGSKNSYIKDASDGDTIIKYFEIPKLYYIDNTITIKFVVKDMHLLDNTPVVGTWYGKEFYNLKEYGSVVSVAITGGGELVASSSCSNYLGGEVMETFFDDNYMTISVGSYSKTEKNFYVYGTSAVVSYSYSSDTPNDCYFLVKVDPSMATSDISFKWYTTVAKDECVAAAYGADGTLLGTLYLNKTTNLMIPGVTIDVTSGANFYDDGAKFTVTRGDVTYLTIE